jgi:hypothetical protein
LNMWFNLCSDLSECVHIPLPELTAERYEKEQWRGQRLYILCPELLQSTAADDRERHRAAPSDSITAASVQSDSGGQKGSVVDGRSEVGPWAEGLQACIRLQRVFGHDEVYLVR